MIIKIFIDAGHNDSSWNTGAVGNGLREQDITFAVAYKLSGLLRAKGLDIKLSRPTKQTNLGTNNNSSLSARYNMANQWGANYFISIHCNAGGGTGTETYYYKADSQTFAQSIQNTFINEMGTRNRGVKKSNFAVISYTKMPAILLELGFIDHATDAKMLSSKTTEMAQAIAKGIYQHLGIKEEKIMIEKKNMNVNGKTVSLSSIFHDSRNYIQLDELARLGLFDLKYDANTKLITIQSK